MRSTFAVASAVCRPRMNPSAAGPKSECSNLHAQHGEGGGGTGLMPRAGRAAGARVEAAVEGAELEQPIGTERRQLLLRQRFGSLVQQRGRHREG